MPETTPATPADHVVLVQQRPARYYRRQGYSHRMVPLAQADRMTIDQARDVAWRVMGEARSA